ncbi:MAG: hypothetical protein IH840_01990 [Candidatus Heimdallarchaeota archaeon]|nr:hypothetical protein [Candidatus Heimdallarchaeota archaeon]
MSDPPKKFINTDIILAFVSWILALIFGLLASDPDPPARASNIFGLVTLGLIISGAIFFASRKK